MGSRENEMRPAKVPGEVVERMVWECVARPTIQTAE